MIYVTGDTHGDETRFSKFKKLFPSGGTTCWSAGISALSGTARRRKRSALPVWNTLTA